MPKVSKSSKASKQTPKSPSPERLELVIRSAGELFLERGYSGVSLEMIVAKTGGSFRDLYREFGGKEELFRRVLEDSGKGVLQSLQNATPPGDDAKGSFEDALFSIGQGFLRVLLSPRVLAIHRLMVSEASRFPDMSALFLKIGPQSAYHAVGELLKTRFSAEKIELDDPTLAAKLFLDMITADLQLRALTGGKISRTEVDERARIGARVFLEGIKRA